MKYVITIAWCFFFVSLHAQTTLRTTGLRLGTGFATMFDQKEAGIIRPAGLTKEVSLYDHLDVGKYGMRWELGWANQAVIHRDTDERLRLNYANIAIAPSFPIVNKANRLYTGIYAGVLLQRSFYSPVIRSVYEFSPFDFGLMVGYERTLYSRVKLDVRVRQGLVNIFNHGESEYNFTVNNSEWIVNFHASVGVILVLFRSEKDRRK